MKNSDSIRSKRHRFDHLPNSSQFSRKKHRPVVINTASIHIQPLGLPLVSTTQTSSSESINLEPYRPYTIGRAHRHCDFVFEDRRVSKKHFQILFDALNRKICISDGVFWSGCGGFSRVRVSMNGVFVNGVRIVGGEVAELGAGDEVSLVCGNEGVCSLGVRIGFVVQRIVFVEEVFNGTVSNFGENGCGGVVASVNLLLSQCRQILHSNDPISSIRKCDFSHRVNSVLGLMLSNVGKFPMGGVSELRGGNLVEPPSGEDSHADQRLENVNVNANMVQLSSVIRDRETTVVYEANAASECHNFNGNHLQQMEHVGAPLPSNVANGKPKTLCLDSAVKDGLPLQQMEHVGAPLANGVVNGKPKALCLDSIVKDSGLPSQQMEHVGASLANGVANGKPKPLCLDSIVKDSGLPLQQMEHFGAPLASSVASGQPNPLCLDSTVKDNGLPLQQMEQFGAPLASSVANGKPMSLCLDSTVKDYGLPLQQMEQYGAPLASSVPNGKPKTLYLDSMVKENTPQFHWGAHDENQIGSIPPPGNKFYLNRLQTMGHGSLDHHDVVSLPELLYPVESLSQIFIATFTSDILWFLSYCDIPAHLPVTIACHNREGCWSSSPDKRISVPFSDFPNLVVVYPPFPEVIAFGNDRKRSGIACHHPKLLVLQREESIRVVITSANLVEKQWNSVTNTIWWQDFPRASRPDYLSLFTQLSDGDINQYSKSDFAAQLGGFMASLVADVPSQAHWILELTKYDFKGAVGHLVASVPGIHSRRAPSILEPMYFLPGEQCASQSYGVKVLGSIETSVVGLSHLFRTSTDTNGSQLKKLASFLGKCYENANGMLEIVLRRNTNIPADANAVSILVPNPEEFSEGDCVQLGFLPRNIAKWVAPLSDSGLFRFSGYVYPKEVLVTALEGSTSLVQMILYVSQGPTFLDISKEVQSEHVSAICLLVASIQRSTGLWRLQEVLSRYKWPEYLETDFVFGSSSIGSVTAQFLAAFSAASGKTSVQFSDSDESDPDWGCWSASQEIRNPSIRIIFPTIERVKNANCGILASKFLLCFSQKTWQRLRNVGMLHDAIPYPNNRVNHPMHVKPADLLARPHWPDQLPPALPESHQVARRRFQSKKDASSFGWVYSGSHNFSAAAWGHPISNSLRTKAVGAVKTNSVLGSRLHVCNYELGIVFIVPPSDANGSPNHKSRSLDDIILPFVVPAPKYRPSDTPATKQAMREALAEWEREMSLEAIASGELMEEEIPDEEEEVLEATDYVVKEREDEKAYADILWSQS
ncbi:hypothetical protein HYC85_028817 [Camellia sinensis]|uniref:FHA domain-containing protein n=1 Tax=Camellia sinensis TaxID=4442 RepID=A0A7J7G073_CAMSI|nr:hypothetical protein HYC85_028817 [Camellia sinensis]